MSDQKRIPDLQPGVRLILPNPHSKFASGAVKEMRNHDVVKRLQELAADFPSSVEDRANFRRLGSEYVFARKLIAEEHFRGSWIVLVRFGRSLEERFGLSSEVPIIYSPHDDIQSRTVTRIPEMLGYLPDDRSNYTRWLTFLSSSDVRLAFKLDEFSDATKIFIPLWRKSQDSDAESLIRDMAKRIHSIDPYTQHGSVTGDQFFGRRVLLNSISANVKNQQIPAIFGMRKTGKTSVLMELERQNRIAAEESSGTTRTVYVYQDLEDLPDIDFGNPVRELMLDLTEKIRRRLSESKFRTQPLSELNEESSLLEFKRAMQRILHHNSSRNLHLVIILDEIEYLCPPGAENGRLTSTSSLVPQFFGVLRKLVQESAGGEGGRVSLILAGLASASVEARQLYGRENPLFSFAKPYYVSPLTIEDTTDLLQVLGARQGFHWSAGAATLVHTESGGHAILVRELASQATRNIADHGLEIVSIDESAVRSVLPKYQRAVSSQIDQILSHIEKFYSTEWQLLEHLMSEGGLDEFDEVYPAAINRLENLGIIQLVDNKWTASKLLALGWKASLDPLKAAKSDAEKSQKILDHIATGESKRLEFKTTFSVPVAGGKESDVRDSFIKVGVSFLNSIGGTIYVGVDDAGTVVGLKKDMQTCQGSLDQLTLKVQSILNASIGRAVSSGISISFPEIKGERIMSVEFPASPEPVWPQRAISGKSDVLWVRQNANTQALAGQDITSYVNDHFHKTN
ncbi:UNVERIFIED_CONTAM: AAA domain-containing protein [Williamsia faeni]